VVQRLRDVLRADGPTYQLDACLDGPGGFTLESPAGDGGAAIHPGPSTPSVEQWPDTLPTVAGLTSWDVAASPRNQLRAAGAWHGLADGGTAAIVSAESLPSEEAADLLRHAWEHTDVVRLRFVRAAARSTQLTALWSQGE
jgi:hypothetical protein